MKKISRRSFLHASGLLAASAVLGGLSGCGGSASSGGEAGPAGDTSSAAASGRHDPITIMDANRDYTALMDLVHQTYPEIELKIEPYRGRNTSAYMKKQLTAGILPDIYNTTQIWDEELQKEHLLDLSPYAVTELYNPARLNEVDVDGAIYLLPYDFSIQCITCNASLLERLGLAAPSSFAQLRDETIPALREAGVNISDCQINLPGYGFQYFFGLANTGFVNTLEGRQWQKDFLAGTANASDYLQTSKDYFQQWIDCGLLNRAMPDASISDIRSHFREGNTAFSMTLLTSLTQNDDGTGDQYILLPYFSEDGSHNVYTFQPGRCYGLSKHLADPGNEQKLEDALHVLEVLSTQEGYQAVIGAGTSTMCSIQDFSLPEDSPYYDAMTAISNGYVAPLIYAGWEDYIVPFGSKTAEWIDGGCTGDDALALLDATQQEVLTHGTTYYADITEELDTAQTAQLCGQIFMEAAGADAALISYNIYYPDVNAGQENSYGANGTMLPGPMSEEDITIFLPTGWYDTLQAAHITGAEAKHLAAEGCDLRGNGRPYPYVFLTRDGKPLDDNTVYRVVVCGFPKDSMDTMEIEDTGIVGLDAAKEYFLKVGEVSSALLDASLLQS